MKLNRRMSKKENISAMTKVYGYQAHLVQHTSEQGCFAIPNTMNNTLNHTVSPPFAVNIIHGLLLTVGIAWLHL